MKKYVKKALEEKIKLACEEKGIEPTRRMLRGVKKFYKRQNGERRKEMRD